MKTARHNFFSRQAMNLGRRALLGLLSCELLISTLIGCAGHRVTLPEVRPPAPVFEPLSEVLKKSYLTLFETASQLEFTDAQIAKMQEYLKQAQDYCVGRFENVSSEYQRRVAGAQQRLKKSGITAEECHNLHLSNFRTASFSWSADFWKRWMTSPNWQA